MPQVEGVDHRFVEANGVRIHVAEAGPPDGDPLVLLHGWPQHWYLWRHQIGPLARGRRVLCPDLRGLGWTDAPADGYEKEALTDDLFALLDALEIERAGLIGHDWGGWIAFLAGLRDPNRVEAILALGIVPPMGRTTIRAVAGAWRFWYQVLLASPIGGRVAASLASDAPGSPARWLGTGVWDEFERETFLGQFREPDRARASVQYYRTFQFRELPAIARGRYADAHLAVPARLLFGEREQAMSAAMLEGAEERADDLTVEILPGLGHFIPEQRPDLVLDRARELFGVPAGDGGDRPR
jgi:pimeloyl-ACP methyl ester carboxylesterase